MNKKNRSLVLLVILIVAVLTGCGGKKEPEPTISAEQIREWAQQTVQAIVAQDAPSETQIAVVPQTTPTSQVISLPPTLPALPTAVPTIKPQFPSYNVAQPAAQVCDQFGFVADVTIPDKSAMQPNQGFTKTWRISNKGTCNWTPAYQFVFYSGDQLNAATAVQIPRNVAPGETIDISVDMRAPNFNGEFQGNWLMRNASGGLFGTSTSLTPVWVKITVSGAAQNASTAPVGSGGGSGTCSVLSIEPTANRSFNANESFNFAVTVRNDSPTTWTRSDFDVAFIDGNYMLRTPGKTLVDIPYDVAPGQNLYMELDGVAPNTPGNFPMTWGVVQNNVINCSFTFNVVVR